MDRRQQLIEQYEDALVALLVDHIMEYEGRELSEMNERLKGDPAAAVPEQMSKRICGVIGKGMAKG